MVMKGMVMCDSPQLFEQFLCVSANLPIVLLTDVIYNEQCLLRFVYDFVASYYVLGFILDFIFLVWARWDAFWGCGSDGD